MTFLIGSSYCRGSKDNIPIHVLQYIDIMIRIGE